MSRLDRRSSLLALIVACAFGTARADETPKDPADPAPADPPAPDGNENDGGFDEVAMIGGGTNHVGIDVQLADPKNVTAPNLKPNAGSPVLTGCGTPPTGLDQTATFCGAIGDVDWTVGWTAFPE